MAMVTVTIQGKDWEDVQANAAEMFGTTYVAMPKKIGRPRKNGGLPEGVPFSGDESAAPNVAESGASVSSDAAGGEGSTTVSAPETAAPTPVVVSLDQVKEVVKKYMAKHGLPATAALVQKVTGKEKLTDAPEDTYAALIAACNQEL